MTLCASTSVSLSLDDGPEEDVFDVSDCGRGSLLGSCSGSESELELVVGEDPEDEVSSPSDHSVVEYSDELDSPDSELLRDLYK